MGLFGNILSSLTQAAGLGYEVYKDQHLTGAQREANQFSADQTSLNRNFQAAQAEIARDWQENQYLKYNSPAAMMSQYRDAGLNPALMYQQGASPASVSTASPSGDSAASVSPSGGDVVGMLGRMMELSMLSEQQRGLRLENERKEVENSLLNKYGDVESSVRVQNLQQDLENKKVQAALNKQGISESKARESLALSQRLLNDIDAKYKSRLNELEQNLRSAQISNIASGTRVNNKQVESLTAQINELYQRAILEAAQAGNLDQQTQNLLKEFDILSYDAEQKEYYVDRKGLTYWTSTIGNIFGAAASAAGTFGALGVGARTFGLVGDSARTIVKGF